MNAAGEWKHVSHAAPDTEYWLCCEGEYATGFYCSESKCWCYGSPDLDTRNKLHIEVHGIAEINHLMAYMRLPAKLMEGSP